MKVFDFKNKQGANLQNFKWILFPLFVYIYIHTKKESVILSGSPAFERGSHSYRDADNLYVYRCEMLLQLLRAATGMVVPSQCFLRHTSAQR